MWPRDSLGSHGCCMLEESRQVYTKQSKLCTIALLFFLQNGLQHLLVDTFTKCEEHLYYPVYSSINVCQYSGGVF